MSEAQRKILSGALLLVALILRLCATRGGMDPVGWVALALRFAGVVSFAAAGYIRADGAPPNARHAAQRKILGDWLLWGTPFLLLFAIAADRGATGPVSLALNLAAVASFVAGIYVRGTPPPVCASGPTSPETQPMNMNAAQRNILRGTLIIFGVMAWETLRDESLRQGPEEVRTTLKVVAFVGVIAGWFYLRAGRKPRKPL